MTTRIYRIDRVDLTTQDYIPNFWSLDASLFSYYREMYQHNQQHVADFVGTIREIDNSNIYDLAKALDIDADEYIDESMVMEYEIIIEAAIKENKIQSDAISYVGYEGEKELYVVSTKKIKNIKNK